MQHWIEVSVEVNPEIEEAVTNYLFELGCTGSEQTENSVIAYFPAAASERLLLENIQRYLRHLSELQFSVPSIDIRFRMVRDQDWNTEWKKYFKPVVVSERLVVKPSWEDYVRKGNEVVIDIDPKQAFGTGTHETTRIMLDFMLQYLQEGDTVLDVGTGTGILAIAAAKFGAGKVVACDNDVVAVEAAAENIRHNATPSVRLFAGELTTVTDGGVQFDLIFANLNKQLVLALLPELQTLLSPKGRLIVSGVLQDDRSDVLTNLSQLIVVDEMKLGEWLGLVIAKGSN